MKDSSRIQPESGAASNSTSKTPTARTVRRIAVAAALASVTALVLSSGSSAPTNTASRGLAAASHTSDPHVIRVAGAGLVAPGKDVSTTTSRISGGGDEQHAAPTGSRASSDVQRLSHAQSARSRTEKSGRPAHDAGSAEEDDEEVGKAAGSGTSTALMTYHGGAVQTAPRIYLVLWGSQWQTTGDPNGVANQLHYFFSGISGSTLAKPLTQYGSNYGSFTNAAGQYRGWLRDTTAVPTTPTQAQIAAAAKRAAVAVGDYSYNAQFMIALPYGHLDALSAAGKACAWHTYTYVNSTSWVTYSALPYAPYLDKVNSAKGLGTCGGGMVNGTAGLLDGVTINAGHEYAETVTNPAPNAWYDINGIAGEIGDKCSWYNLANRTLANGRTFAVQPEWSNYFRTHYGNGCLYSS